MELVDRDGTVWSADGGVREALERFDNQFGHVFLREKAREEEGRSPPRSRLRRGCHAT